MDRKRGLTLSTRTVEMVEGKLAVSEVAGGQGGEFIFFTRPRCKHPPGFLLLAIVALLAVLLVLCVGFLSYTRTEVRAVAHLRDKIDARDISQAALDFTIANISEYLFKADGTHSTRHITN